MQQGNGVSWDKKYYRFTGNFMEIFRPGGLTLTQNAADIIGLCPGDSVLDIGCGLGTSLCFLRDKYNIEAFGVDIHPEAAEKAKLNLGTDHVFCGDAEDLAFEDGAFDAAFMECVLSLTNNPEKALAEAWRVLKSGGYIVISSLDGADTLLDNGRIGREALLEKLEDLGFNDFSVFDETAELRRFVAEIIFAYDSIENYIEAANLELGGSVLNCNVPIKGTGYILIIASKK